MLKITSDGRKLGLDQRLMNTLLPDDPDSKLNACVGNILRIWQDGQADKLTQLVFCDLRHAPFLLLGFMFQLIARHLLHTLNIIVVESFTTPHHYCPMSVQPLPALTVTLLSCQTPAWHHQLISNRFLYFPISGTLLALYIVYLAVLFFQSTSAKKRRGSTSRSTRTVNPKLGSLGSFGFAGFLGFWTYRVDQAIFPFVFFVFFGFFGFFYEGKMSNTLIDERYKENKMRAQSTANKTALSIIFLQY